MPEFDSIGFRALGIVGQPNIDWEAIASFRGPAGLIRPVGTYTVDPIGESSSRMDSELDLEGHGIGKLFAPLALRQAAKQVPVDLKKFKELLESGVAAAASK